MHTAMHAVHDGSCPELFFGINVCKYRAQQAMNRNELGRERMLSPCAKTRTARMNAQGNKKTTLEPHAMYFKKKTTRNGPVWSKKLQLADWCMRNEFDYVNAVSQGIYESGDLRILLGYCSMNKVDVCTKLE